MGAKTYNSFPSPVSVHAGEEETEGNIIFTFSSLLFFSFRKNSNPLSPIPNHGRGFKMLFLHLFRFTLFVSVLSTVSSDLAADRDALLRLSSAVRGRTLRWNRSDPNPCSWVGVRCNGDRSRVTELRLPGKGLSGEIPLNTVGNLSNLRFLSLRGNSISGTIPLDLGSCVELRRISLQENQFSGEFPETLFALSNIFGLELAGNNLSGELSSGFNNLTHLRILRLERNQFSGSLSQFHIPSSLRDFNVSINRLNGSIPSNLQRFPQDAFLGNSLCGSPLPSCPRTNEGNNLSGGAIAGIVIGSIAGFVFFLLVSFIFWRKYNNRKTLQRVEMSPIPPSPVKHPETEYRSHEAIMVRENRRSKKGNLGRVKSIERTGGVTKRTTNDGLVFFGDSVEVFSVEELLRASAEVLGKGTMGTTYKAYLESGDEVVVKRLRNVCVTEREFRERIKKLGTLVHENLVPLKAYYYGREEKLLVYQSMPMRSLASLLHGTRGSDRRNMMWETRTEIASGIARGLRFLHSVGPNTISHGNIKSSNILLTAYSTASLSEFGISHLISASPQLDGYRAPEVIDSRKFTHKADVYSFGVLLLELLTGKDPTGALGEDGVDLPKWVVSVVEEKWTIDVFDPQLIKHRNNEEQMVQLLHLAIRCSSQQPDKRPSMDEVAQNIEEICGSRQEEQGQLSD